MSLGVTFAILLAAVLHAGWNALVKIRGDRIAAIAVITSCSGFLALLFAPFVAFPDPACWSLLLLTILIHTVYHFVLAVAYNHGDLGQIYPIARGSAPLLVAFGALLFAAERLAPVTLLGVLFLSTGVMALAFERGKGVFAQPRAILYALLTGSLIATYTVVDGLGVRRAGSPLSFAVWLTIGDGFLTFLVIFAWKRRALINVLRRSLTTGILGSTMQIAAYWIVLWALSGAPMATVSALRETSVLFAALLSTFVLHEGFGVWRFVSAGLVSLGLVLTRAGR